MKREKTLIVNLMLWFFVVFFVGYTSWNLQQNDIYLIKKYNELTGNSSTKKECTYIAAYTSSDVSGTISVKAPCRITIYVWNTVISDLKKRDDFKKYKNVVLYGLTKVED